MKPELLEVLTLADGKPLPPSLRAWFTYDAKWQPFEIDTKQKRLRAKKFNDLLEAALPDIAPAFAELGRMLLTGDCYRIFVPSECDENTVLFLYGPLADKSGEMPAIGFCFSDDGFVGVFACGFDVYLARVMQVCEAVPYAFGAGPKPYASATKQLIKSLVAAAPKPVQKKLHVDDDVIWVGQLTDR